MAEQNCGYRFYDFGNHSPARHGNFADISMPHLRLMDTWEALLERYKDNLLDDENEDYLIGGVYVKCLCDDSFAEEGLSIVAEHESDVRKMAIELGLGDILPSLER